MGDSVKNKLAKPIHLTDQIAKAAEEASGFKQECYELKSKADKLAGLLRQAARASSELYERPAIRIIEDTGQVLERALSLVLKCKTNGILKRVFTIIPTTAFRKMSFQLENSIGDVSWLLRVSASADDRDNQGMGLPPIASNEPNLGYIWNQIASLHTGTMDYRWDAATVLVSLARDNDRNSKMVIEEGGVPPLLKLLKEGKPDGQENAAKAIGLLGRDAESVDQILMAGVCSVFAKILKEGPMKVQAEVAYAVYKLTSNHPKCQDLFLQSNVVRLLVVHLAFETVQEHSKYAIVTHKPTSIGAVVNAAATNKEKEKSRSDDLLHKVIPHPMGNVGNRFPTQLHNVVATTMAAKLPQSNANQAASQQNYSAQGVNFKGRENEEPATKNRMKAMAALALWQLAKGNSQVCRNITESRALLCFAALLEKGTKEVQYNSAMALMEITAVAEKDPELRRSAFKPNSPACKAVVDQLLTIIENENPDLLAPCIEAIGNLARTFRSTETRIIAPLVKLLEDREAEISTLAAIALTKFASKENYLHVDHSKAIAAAGGAKHLVQLVYFGDKQSVKVSALRLLCCISRHVPDSAELAEADALTVVEWASKQSFINQEESLEWLLDEARSKLELYQSRNSRVIMNTFPKFT